MNTYDYLQYPEDWPPFIVVAMTQAFGHHFARDIKVRVCIQHHTVPVWEGFRAKELFHYAPSSTTYEISVGEVTAYEFVGGSIQLKARYPLVVLETIEDPGSSLEELARWAKEAPLYTKLRSSNRPIHFR